MKAWKGGYYGKRRLKFFLAHTNFGTVSNVGRIFWEFVIDFLKGKKNKDHGKQL